MIDRFGHIRRTVIVRAILETFFFFLIAGLRPVQAAQSTEAGGRFEVKVGNGYLSLKADQAPLVQILEEIGRQAKITIDSNIGPEEKITKYLDRVPLEDGIRQLAKNVSFVYAQDAKTNNRRVARVIVLSEASGVSAAKKSPQPEKANQAAEKPAKATTPQKQPEAFKFEFDPTKVPEKKAPSQKEP